MNTSGSFIEPSAFVAMATVILFFDFVRSEMLSLVTDTEGGAH